MSFPEKEFRLRQCHSPLVDSVQLLSTSEPSGPPPVWVVPGQPAREQAAPAASGDEASKDHVSPRPWLPNPKTLTVGQMVRLLRDRDKTLAINEDPPRVSDEFTVPNSVLIACPAYHEFVNWANIKLGRNADFKAAETLQSRLAMRLGKNFGEIDLMPLADAMRVISENAPAPPRANETAPIWAERLYGGRVAFYPEKCIAYPVRSDGNTDETLYFDPSDQRVILWGRHWVLTAKNNVPGPPILVDGPCRIVSFEEAREALRRAGKAIPKELDVSSPPRPEDEKPAAAPASGTAPADPLSETLDLIPRSTHAINLIKFVAAKSGRTATLKDICKHIYKSTAKPNLAKTRLLIRRTGISLDRKNAPLRIFSDRETRAVELIDR